MSWTDLDTAAEIRGCSRRTLERAIAAGTVPARFTDSGAREVWTAPMNSPAWAVALEAKVDLLLEKIEAQAPAPKPQVQSPRQVSKRPAQRPAEPRQARPADASPAVGWRAAWEQLVLREGSAAAAGRLLGVGQPAASRWSSGRRTPQLQAQQRIVKLAAELELEERKAA